MIFIMDHIMSSCHNSRSQMLMYMIRLLNCHHYPFVGMYIQTCFKRETSHLPVIIYSIKLSYSLMIKLQSKKYVI